MRQVPCYGIVGDGKLAQHFSHYLKSKNLKVKQWSRKEGAEFCEHISDRLAGCDVILVLISDDQIVPFLETHRKFFESKAAVHCSGRVTTPLARGAHPLMSFGPHLYDVETYENTLIAVEGEVAWFQELFPTLENPLFPIDAKDKDLYHSLCVMSGNFTTLLWQKFFADMQERFKIPSHYLLPYLQQIARNLSSAPDQALTGPLARGDIETLRADMNAIAGDPFHEVFESFVRWKSPKALRTLQKRSVPGLRTLRTARASVKKTSLSRPV